jgi:cardiolipin-specific phospholipase
MSQSLTSKISFCNSKFTTNDAVDFFLNPLDAFLYDGNLFEPGEEIWLVGHSLGGYLSAKYAMRTIQTRNATNSTGPSVKKLILASPVGFQPAPTSHERIPSSSLPSAFRILDTLWSANLTPQALIRIMGSSRGRSTIKRALHGRIPHLNQSTIEDNYSKLDLLADYLYHVTVAPASGEYAVNSLLEPAASEEGAGVYARQPLGDGKLTAALKSNVSSQHQLTSVKVLYGDLDWMRFNEVATRKEIASIQSSCRIAASVHIIPNAGHHLYIDNASSFVNQILDD